MTKVFWCCQGLEFEAMVVVVLGLLQDRKVYKGPIAARNASMMFEVGARKEYFELVRLGRKCI